MLLGGFLEEPHC